MDLDYIAVNHYFLHNFHIHKRPCILIPLLNLASNHTNPTLYRSILTVTARLTNAYDATNQRYRNSRAKIKQSKTHILPCMSSKLSVKFHRCPWKFHKKTLNAYTAKYAFYEGLKQLKMSYSYDILRLSQTGRWTSLANVHHVTSRQGGG